MRVMFRSNAVVASNLTDEQKNNKYHLLYYQFVKHAFGFRYCNPEHESDVYLRLYFDRIPDTTRQNEEFKAHIIGLQSTKPFQQARIKIRQLGYPHFNIGISTGSPNQESRWTDPYRHWSFTPHEFMIDEGKLRGINEKAPFCSNNLSSGT